jgi:protein tyrosine/serine phosphatase
MYRLRFVALLLCAGLTSVAADLPAIPNFHQVDGHLYRGAQPSARDFPSLARMGVKTVLDLRDGAGHVRGEQKQVQAAGMRYVSLPMNGLEAPSEQQIARALEILQDEASGPVFVHCRRGADRTGTVVACYRIAHDRWPNQKALDEARTFGMSWLERGMRNYVLRFQTSGSPALALPAANSR